MSKSPSNKCKSERMKTLEYCDNTKVVFKCYDAFS
jgi:hypothetical protein